MVFFLPHCYSSVHRKHNICTDKLNSVRSRICCWPMPNGLDSVAYSFRSLSLSFFLLVCVCGIYYVFSARMSLPSQSHEGLQWVSAPMNALAPARIQLLQKSLDSPLEKSTFRFIVQKTIRITDDRIILVIGVIDTIPVWNAIHMWRIGCVCVCLCVCPRAFYGYSRSDQTLKWNNSFEVIWFGHCRCSAAGFPSCLSPPNRPLRSITNGAYFTDTSRLTRPFHKLFQFSRRPAFSPHCAGVVGCRR